MPPKLNRKLVHLVPKFAGFVTKGLALMYCVYWFLLLTVNSVYALDCTPHDIVLSNQEEVDNFQSIHGPNCDTVTGRLSFSAQPDITDLSGLSGLRHINGDLRIFDVRQLVSLEGLNNLESIGGTLEMKYCTALQNTNGLESLVSVGGRIEINQNPSLKNIDSFEALESAGEISIHSNNSLQRVGGFNNLKSVSEDFHIRHNRELTEISRFESLEWVGGTFGISGLLLTEELNAFSSLESIGGFFYLTSFGEMEEVHGFDNLRNVFGGLTIEGNSSLRNLLGLSSLRHVGSDILIKRNGSLENLNGLDGITGTAYRNLTIQDNDALVDLGALSGITRVLGHLVISQNDALADLDDWSNLTSISGAVSVRENKNLASISGLFNVAGTVSHLEIIENAQLTDLDGLFGIEAVIGSLIVRENDRLENLEGLSNVSRVNGGLAIRGNLTLTNLDGLHSLISVQNDAHIHDNPQLQFCGGIIQLLDDLDDGVAGPGPGPDGVPDLGGELRVEDNGSNCSSIAAILSQEESASFQVNATFSDGNPQPTNVELICDTPTILVDPPHSSASSSSPAIFQVRRFLSSITESCSASQVASPAGYSEDTTDCQGVPLINGGNSTCKIVNQQNPVNLAVDVKFTDGYTGSIQVILKCSDGEVLVLDPSASQSDSANFTVQHFPYDGTTCVASQIPIASHFQQSSDCLEVFVTPGLDQHCVIYNGPVAHRLEPATASMTGSWYDPSSAGEGFMIHTVDEQSAVAYFYGFDNLGDRLWLIAISQGPFNWDQPAVFDAYRVTGGDFGSFDPDEIVESNWGTLTIVFNSCSFGLASLSGVDGEKDLVLARLGDVAGSPCLVPVPHNGTNAVTGSWYDPATAGQGLAVQKISLSRGVVYFYGFEDSGSPLWLIGTWEQGLEFDVQVAVDLYQVSGGTWSVVNPGEVNEEFWGTLYLTFNDCFEATAQLNGLEGEQSLNLILLAGSAGLECTTQ